MKDYTEGKRVALIACLAAKARMRARDDVATMFCKRMAAKAKKAREELAEIHRQQQEIVEALIGNYRTLLQQVDTEGPAQRARSRAAALTKDALDALEGLEEDAGPAEVAERLGGKVSAVEGSAGSRPSTRRSRRCPPITATTGRCCCTGI
ncbi:hypothetical protein ACIBHX_13475 [Nonomuraea sp. NPDC050536]|uniref:hypothetical protein n=1 Tax=Nonomuraea sp. NPDC050536 TaxID=3364366 RepID=UPI0037CB76D5